MVRLFQPAPFSWGNGKMLRQPNRLYPLKGFLPDMPGVMAQKENAYQYGIGKDSLGCGLEKLEARIDPGLLLCQIMPAGIEKPHG